MRKNFVQTARAPRRRTGNILFTILLTIVPVMGFAALAVDYGVLVHDKNHLQRACDASALAAAQELKVSGNDDADTANATTVAIATAAQNGVTVTSDDISFSDDNSNVTVSADLTRNLFFARVLGIVTGDVGASATAGAGGMASHYSPYVSPIGITMDDYNSYKYNPDTYDSDNIELDSKHTFYLIRHNKEALELNDLVLYDLRKSNGKAGPKMAAQLTGDARETVTIYDGACTNTSCQQSLNSAKNSQTKFLTGALDTLFSRAAGSPWFDDGDSGWYDKMRLGQADYSNPRVINIIVTDLSDAQNGNSNMPVRAFVPVYIEDYSVTGKNKNTDVTITFHFLPTPHDLEPELITGGAQRQLRLLK